MSWFANFAQWLRRLLSFRLHDRNDFLEVTRALKDLADLHRRNWQEAEARAERLEIELHAAIHRMARLGARSAATRKELQECRRGCAERDARISALESRVKL